MDNYSGSPLNDSASQNRPTGSGAPFQPSLGAIILIAIGALLFLDNLDLLPFAHLRAYWPLAISAIGVSKLASPKSKCNFVWPMFWIALGIVLTLQNLGLFHISMKSLWPLFLIAIGVNMLVQRTGSGWISGRPRRRQNFFSGPGNPGFSSPQQNAYREPDSTAVFASVNRRIDSPNFEGAELHAVFGELKVDLRGCTISTPNREAVIETHAAFGAIKLRIPETWRVALHGNAVFGAYEDKTLPPRPGPGIEPPTLILRGNAAFGAVEVEN